MFESRLEFSCSVLESTKVLLSNQPVHAKDETSSQLAECSPTQPVILGIDPSGCHGSNTEFVFHNNIAQCALILLHCWNLTLTTQIFIRFAQVIHHIVAALSICIWLWTRKDFGRLRCRIAANIARGKQASAQIETHLMNTFKHCKEP